MIEGKHHDYEQESHAKTLVEAHAIRKDGKKHAHALKHVKHMAKHSSHAADAHSFETKNAQGPLTNGEGSAAEDQNDEAK